MAKMPIFPLMVAAAAGLTAGSMPTKGMLNFSLTASTAWMVAELQAITMMEAP